MFEALFGNVVAEKSLLFIANYGEGHINGIAKAFSIAPSQVERQLKKLEAAGILVSRMIGSARVFTLNPRLAIKDELTGLLEKVLSLLPQLPRLSGKHRLTLFFSRGNDYGTLRLSVNGKTLASEIDTGPTAAARPEPIVTVDAGVVELAGKDDTLRIEVTGKGARSKAPFYQFGFDGLTAKRE